MRNVVMRNVENARGNRIVVVLDRNWGVERQIGVCTYGNGRWRVAETQHIGVLNESSHFVATVEPGQTYLRVLTNRDDAFFDRPVDANSALRALQSVVPRNDDTFLDLQHRQLVLFNVATGNEANETQSLFEMMTTATLGARRLIPAIYCPKRNVIGTP